MLRCQICCKPTDYGSHTVALDALSSLDKKTYGFVEKDLELHTRQVTADETDEAGNPVVCPGCLHVSIVRAKKVINGSRTP